MSDRNPILKRILRLITLLFSLAVLGCGQGGTEVGNPNPPAPAKVPTGAGGDTPQEAAPALEGPAPSPSPQALLLKNSEDSADDSEEPGALLNPEETS